MLIVLALFEAVNALNGRIDFTNKEPHVTSLELQQVAFALLLKETFRCEIESDCHELLTKHMPPKAKDLAATQESLHTTQNSLSDCFNEVVCLWGG